MDNQLSFVLPQLEGEAGPALGRDQECACACVRVSGCGGPLFLQIKQEMTRRGILLAGWRGDGSLCLCTLAHVHRWEWRVLVCVCVHTCQCAMPLFLSRMSPGVPLRLHVLRNESTVLPEVIITYSGM